MVFGMHVKFYMYVHKNLRLVSVEFVCKQFLKSTCGRILFLSYRAYYKELCHHSEKGTIQ